MSLSGPRDAKAQHKHIAFNKLDKIMWIPKFLRPSYLGEYALSERCVWLFLIKGPDAFFKLIQGEMERKKKYFKLTNAFCLILAFRVHEHTWLHLTDRRLWFISAPSIRLRLSVSFVSEARSLPAKSTNHILQAHTKTHAVITQIWNRSTLSKKTHREQLEFSSIWIRMFQSNKKKVDIVFQLTSQPSAGLDVLAEFEASHGSERRVDSHHWSLVCAQPCHVKLPLCIWGKKKQRLCHKKKKTVALTAK